MRLSIWIGSQYFLVALVPLQGCGLDSKCLPEDILRLTPRWNPRSVPPLSDQWALMLREDREFLDRLVDSGLFVGRINDPNELGRGTAQAVDGPALNRRVGDGLDGFLAMIQSVS
jgi:hypothetical protein